MVAKKIKKTEKVEEIKVEEKIEEPVQEVKEPKYIAIVDINLTYRKGDEVPERMIKQWRISQLNIDELVELR